MENNDGKINFEVKDINTQDFYSKPKSDSIGAIEELYKKFYKPKYMDKNIIKIWLENPYSNVDNLQDLSLKMNQISGILKEFINYKSLILTNDHYIYPTESFKYKNKKAMLDDDLKVASYLDKFHIKTLNRWVTKRLFQNGEIYLYKRDTKNEILIQEIPPKLCKIISLDEFGVYRYAVNMKKISEDEIDFYPEEIVKAFHKFNNLKGKKHKDYIDDFYLVKENGFAFQLNQWDSKGLPYYIYLFSELTNLISANDLDDVNNKLDNYKLLYQKILTDDDGKILIGLDTVNLYHSALKRVAPEGVGVITSPLDVKPISLNDGKPKNYEYTNNLKKNIYDNAGVSSELFNGSSKTKESILLSVILDTLVPLEIQGNIENYLNYELKRKFKRGKWKVVFLPTTYFDKEDKIKTERENLTVYGSKKKYLATQGFTPIEALNIIHTEEVLGIEEKMKPMLTAHTISNKEIEKIKNDEIENNEEENNKKENENPDSIENKQTPNESEGDDDGK